jgi:hypothetical protein
MWDLGIPRIFLLESQHLEIDFHGTTNKKENLHMQMGG